jgi:hypothetical protein
MKNALTCLLILVFFPLQTALAQTPTPLTGPYPQPIFQQNIDLVVGTLVLFTILLVGLARFSRLRKT